MSVRSGCGCCDAGTVALAPSRTALMGEVGPNTIREACPTRQLLVMGAAEAQYVKGF